MIFLLSCISGKENTQQETSIETEVLSTYDATLLPSSSCSIDRVPILFVHGFLAAGDGFDRHAARFANNGHCLEQLFALDWNNLEQDEAQSLLVTTIDAILEQTQAEQIDLVGHSAGGSLCASMIQNDDTERVRRYIHVGSSPFESSLPISWLNLTSTQDPIAPGNEIDGTNNIILTQEDHFEVITSPNSFSAMYTFLYDEQPSSNEYQSVQEPTIWGKSLDFGTNVPTEGDVEVYTISKETGLPLSVEPIYTQRIGEAGFIGPFSLQNEQQYELRLIPDKGPIIHHFFSSFDHDTRFLRMRSLPDEGIAAQVLSSLPLEEDTSVALVNYSAHSGMIVDRDHLLIDGEEQLNEARANPENNTIALFHTDINEDQINGEDPSSFALFPFLAGSDTYWEPDTQQSISVSFNGSTLHVPRYGEGILLTLQ